VKGARPSMVKITPIDLEAKDRLRKSRFPHLVATYDTAILCLKNRDPKTYSIQLTSLTFAVRKSH
jgi:hypothetical protein